MVDPNLIATIAGLLGISVKDLLQPLTNLRKARNTINEQSSAARRIENLNRIPAEGVLTKALTRYYSAENLRSGNLLRYVYSSDGVVKDSTMVYRPDWMNLAIPLGDASENCSLVSAEPAPSGFAKATVAKLIQQIEQQNIRIWDAPLYRLIDVSLDRNELRASFAVDQFLRFRFTIGLLQDELLEAIILADFDLDKLFSRRDRALPLRAENLPDGEHLVDFRNRVCAGGIATFFAMARPHPYNDFAIPIQKRSANVSDSQGLLSPLPRAFHQPMIDALSELKLSVTVYRELYEELFGGTESESGVKRLKPDWWLHEAESIQWFLDHKGAYTFECVCLGLDLISGNYHFGIMLVVHDEDFWRKFGHLLVTNWEVADSGGHLVSTTNYEQIREYTQRIDWTEDICIFVEGLRRLKATERRRCTIPRLEVLTPT